MSKKAETTKREVKSRCLEKKKCSQVPKSELPPFLTIFRLVLGASNLRALPSLSCSGCPVELCEHEAQGGLFFGPTALTGQAFYQAASRHC